MNEHLRDRILRRLDALNDERGYQILDYVEFLESKYAERAAPGSNVFQKLAETVEDGLRAGKLSAQTVSQAMGFMNQAMGVLGGVAAAGKSVASDIVSAASSTATYVANTVSPSAPSGGASSAGTAPASTNGGGATGTTAAPSTPPAAPTSAGAAPQRPPSTGEVPQP
jgi:hypothetical protein